MHRIVPIIAVLPLLGLAACQSQQHRHEPARVRADSAQDAAMFEPIRALVGDWESPGEDGAMAMGSRFELTGGGSAVCETMFPGEPYKMTNLYHMDGRRLVITHYCAAGNQPRMAASEARRTDAGLVYEFGFDSVSNLRPEHDHYMGQMTMTIADDGTVREEWRSFDRNGELTEPVVIDLRRKQ